jgi:membrane-associated phospholipid phosphatase
MDIVLKIVADGLVVPVVVLGVYALLRYVPKGSRYQTYARVLMAGLTAYAVAKIAGLLFQPSGLRPFEELGVDPGASFLENPGFPSDHALFTMAITLAIWFSTKRRALTIAALVLTLAVCVGRIVALVHTPLDIVGGLLIACTGVVWYLVPTTSSAKKAAKPRK